MIALVAGRLILELVIYYYWPVAVAQKSKNRVRICLYIYFARESGCEVL